jgi:hypothetical protein
MIDRIEINNCVGISVIILISGPGHWLREISYIYHLF